GGSAWVIVQTHFHEKGEEALNVAETVASMPQVIAAFHQSNPAAVIQPLAEEVRKKTGAEFVVVGNMQLIRYSHPNPQMIGKTMVGNDDDGVLRGEPSVTRAVGTLGLSVRGKAPVFDINHQQIGVVSVGYLVDNIWREILAALLKLAALCAGGAALSLLGAHLLATHIKREIFDMEPAEIAFLTQEQAAILEAIREGIVAVDDKGRVVACNRQAKRLLGLEPQEVLGKPLATAVPHGRLRELLEAGPSGMDQPMVVGNALVVAHRVPVLLHGRPIGAVATFRDKVELDQLDRRLADVERYAEALRSQRHEFMNRLHTIAGLLQLGEYESARELIRHVHHEQQ
ncbi:MAG: sensor histidine kinase, partial [Alicyclobacillus sp.]|nr:sensor histidine kinase [Alicyclobacillus sp.]